MSVDLALRYAKDVTSGATQACSYVQLAAKRFLSDLEAAKAPDSPWEFRTDLAERVMRWCSLLPNIKGPLAGQKLVLMPWQAFVVANLYGFVERGTTTRRFRQGIIYLPRGNGKTTSMAPLMLYGAFAEGEAGAEAYAAATTRDQAKLLWESAKMMAQESPEMRKSLGVQVAAHSIYQPRSGSKCVAVSSDAKSLEGLSVSFACCDEIASHINSSVYDVLLTAMGKRRHPLLICISTATGNNFGVGRTLWDYGVRVLQGDTDDARLFALIYTIDATDDPWAESTWIKANPSWGISVQPDAIRAIMQQARNNPAQEAAAMTRHLNVWQGADEALFSTRAWKACGDPSLRLEDFEGRDCDLGIDLANRVDLASVALVFTDTVGDRSVYTVFSRNYLNEAAVIDARNPSYAGWAKDRHLILTPGNETDFQAIEADVLDLCRRFQVMSVAYDPWNATQMSQRLSAEGINMVEMRQTVGVLSECTKEVQAAIQAGRIRHADDPVLTWCIGNVVGHYDVAGNVRPNRSPHQPEAKIDAALAMIMAVGRSMSNELRGMFSLFQS